MSWRGQVGTVQAESQPRMTGSPTLLRTLLIYSICLPLAIVLGYLITAPMDLSTIVTLGVVLSVLAFPLFVRWNHLWALAAWNTSMVVFFLPGRPPLSMVLAWACLILAFF